MVLREGQIIHGTPERADPVLPSGRTGPVVQLFQKFGEQVHGGQVAVDLRARTMVCPPVPQPISATFGAGRSAGP